MADSSHDDDLQPLSFEHQMRRLGARSTPPKPPPPKRRITRDLVLTGIVVAVMLLLTPFSDVATPDYPEARAQADRLNSAYRSISNGEASIEAVASTEGLLVYEFPAGERTVSVLTHAQPTAAGTCYGLRLGGGFATLAVEFAPTDGCVPQGRSAFRVAGLWEDVLPSERMTTVWFVPALIVLGSCAIVLSTDIVLKLLFK